MLFSHQISSVIFFLTRHQWLPAQSVCLHLQPFGQQARSLWAYPRFCPDIAGQNIANPLATFFLLQWCSVIHLIRARRQTQLRQLLQRFLKPTVRPISRRGFHKGWLWRNGRPCLWSTLIGERYAAFRYALSYSSGYRWRCRNGWGQSGVALLPWKAGSNEVCLTPHFYTNEISLEDFIAERAEKFEKFKPHIPDGVNIVRNRGLCYKVSFQQWKYQRYKLRKFKLYSHWVSV